MSEGLEDTIPRITIEDVDFVCGNIRQTFVDSIKGAGPVEAAALFVALFAVYGLTTIHTPEPERDRLRAALFAYSDERRDTIGAVCVAAAIAGMSLYEALETEIMRATLNAIARRRDTDDSET